MKFTQRTSNKTDPFNFLSTFVFMTMSSIPLGLGLITTLLNIFISRSSLHKKFNDKSVLFFKKCLQLIMTKKLLDRNILKTKILDNFSEVLIIDSSSWDIPKRFQWIFSGSGGNASKANCKLQFCYDYKSGKVCFFEELSGTVPDQRYSRNISKHIKKYSLIQLTIMPILKLLTSD